MTINKNRYDDKRVIEIVYKDENENLKSTKIELKGNYYNDLCDCKSNIQEVVSDIMNDGGLWLDEITILPYHRILKFIISKSSENEQPKQKEEYKAENEEVKIETKYRKKRHKMYRKHRKHLNNSPDATNSKIDNESKNIENVEINVENKNTTE